MCVARRTRSNTGACALRDVAILGARRLSCGTPRTPRRGPAARVGVLVVAEGRGRLLEASVVARVSLSPGPSSLTVASAGATEEAIAKNDTLRRGSPPIGGGGEEWDAMEDDKEGATDVNGASEACVPEANPEEMISGYGSSASTVNNEEAGAVVGGAEARGVREAATTGGVMEPPSDRGARSAVEASLVIDRRMEAVDDNGAEDAEANDVVADDGNSPPVVDLAASPGSSATMSLAEGWREQSAENRRRREMVLEESRLHLKQSGHPVYVAIRATERLHGAVEGMVGRMRDEFRTVKEALRAAVGQSPYGTDTHMGDACDMTDEMGRCERAAERLLGAAEDLKGMARNAEGYAAEEHMFKKLENGGEQTNA